MDAWDKNGEMTEEMRDVFMEGYLRQKVMEHLTPTTKVAPILEDFVNITALFHNAMEDADTEAATDRLFELIECLSVVGEHVGLSIQCIIGPINSEENNVVN